MQPFQFLSSLSDFLQRSWEVRSPLIQPPLQLEAVIWPSSGQWAIRRWDRIFCKTFPFIEKHVRKKKSYFIFLASPPLLPVVDFCCNVRSCRSHFEIMSPQTLRQKTNIWKIVEKKRQKEPSSLIPSLSCSSSSGLHSSRLLIRWDKKEALIV